LALCPPARDLIIKNQVESTQELVSKIEEMRSELSLILRQPSFEICIPCDLRKNLSCQGGCA